LRARKGLSSSLPYLRTSPSEGNVVEESNPNGPTKKYGKLPAINEPLYVRYNRKALFEADEEDLTFMNYRLYKPKNTNHDWMHNSIFQQQKLKDFKEETRVRGLKHPFMATRNHKI